MKNEQGGSGGRDKANSLIGGYGKWLGVYDAELDQKNDRSFGGSGFHYDADKDVLQGRVFIEQAFMPSDPDDVKDKFRKVLRALNDPKIGGMFERAGGTFVLDEEKRMYFLVRDFPVSQMTQRTLRLKMEKLLNVGATWSLHWFGRVAKIAHGWEAPPEQPVTWTMDGVGLVSDEDIERGE